MSSRAWPHACLLLALLSAAAMALAPWQYDTLGWNVSQFAQRPWMAWSATLLDPAKNQWYANLALLMLLAVCGDALGAGRREAACLLLAWPLATTGLLAWPQVTGAVGLSGATHAAGVILIARALATHRLLASVGLAGLLLKLLIEQASLPRAFSPHWDTGVIYGLHLSGTLAGAMLALLLLRRARATRPGG